ncbi:hypothetical protein ACLB2K_028254 [Fragaria x ananassa]
MVYSSISIHVVPSMIAAGKRKTSPDLDQFLSFLKSKSVDDLNSLAYNLVTSILADASRGGGPCLNLVNGLWIDESLPLDHSYMKVLSESFKAALNQVDFKSNPGVRTQVNSWINKETNGLIPEILPPGSVTMESSQGVPFMTSIGHFSISAYDGFKVLQLPYKRAFKDFKDKRFFSMHLLLPDAKNGLPALAGRVCSEPGFLDRHLEWNEVEVRKFLIPKFNISSRFEASGVLEKLGLPADGMVMIHEALFKLRVNCTNSV